MGTAFFPIAGFVLSFALIGVCFILWRKNASLEEALLKQKKDFDYHLASLESAATKQRQHKDQEERSRHEQKVSKLEKDLLFVQNRMKQSEKDGEERSKSAQKEKEDLLNQIERYRLESAALLSQITEIDHEKKLLKEQLSQKDQEATAKNKKADELLQKKIQDLITEKRTAESERHKLEKELAKIKGISEEKAEINPEEVKSLKKRIHQHQYFYRAMKQQKEMVEERNINWEKALQMLAVSIYKEKAPSELIPSNIGPLVGGALELLRQPQLVED